MKTLYLECGMGAAGDMLAAALLELIPDRDGFVERFHQVGIPGVEMRVEKAVKCGITGTHVRMLVHGVEERAEDVQAYSRIAEHPHVHGHEAGQVYRHDEEHGCDCGEGHAHGHEEGHAHRHGEEHEHDCGEGHAHGHEEGHAHRHDEEHGHDCGEGHAHDHEEGHAHRYGEEHRHGEVDGPHHHHHHHHHAHRSMQEIEEIVGRLQIEEQVKRDILAVYRLIAEAESAVHGAAVSEIHFHEVGTMDAIADITAVCMLMREIAPDEVIASPVVTGFGAVRCAHGVLPVPAPATALLLKEIPVYAGRIEAELCTPTGAALLKHFVTKYQQMPVIAIETTGYGMGQKDFAKANCLRAFLGETEDPKDRVTELSCNVDDMTGEEIGFAMERLFAAGALEVYTVPVYMKKNRPGTLLRVLVAQVKREEMVRAIFCYTSTIGIRETQMERYVLRRDVREVETEYGTIRRKEVSGYGVQRAKWEYEDVARVAADKGCSLREISGKLYS